MSNSDELDLFTAGAKATDYLNNQSCVDKGILQVGSRTVVPYVCPIVDRLSVFEMKLLTPGNTNLLFPLRS